MSDFPTPWSTQKRQHTQDKIAKKAAAVAKQLKAKCCIVIAFFEDESCYHVLEGGQSVLPLAELYRQRMEARLALDAAGVSPEGEPDKSPTVQ